VFVPAYKDVMMVNVLSVPHHAEPSKVPFKTKSTYELGGHVPVTFTGDDVNVVPLVGLVMTAAVGKGGASMTDEMVVSAKTR